MEFVALPYRLGCVRIIVKDGVYFGSNVNNEKRRMEKIYLKFRK